MAIRIKICGITNAADARAAVAAGADALGFVFVPGTPRCVTAEQAAAIIAEVPPFVARVGLFVDAPEAAVRATLAATGLDTIQFHGAETPGMCRAFRDPARGPVRLLKAFRVRDAAALDAVAAYADVVDAVLLDAFVAGVAGGTGQAFDWSVADRVRDLTRPVVIAGGLSPANVADAVRRFRPYAVDVSSGVEAAPGRKDPAKVAAFIAAARAAAAEPA